jgi:hypothetical protein
MASVIGLNMFLGAAGADKVFYRNIFSNQSNTIVD